MSEQSGQSGPLPPVRRAPRPWYAIIAALVSLLIGGTVGGAIGAAVVQHHDKAVATATTKKPSQPTPTATGVLPLSARCPAVGSVAYEAAKRAYGEVDVTTDVTSPAIYVAEPSSSLPPLVVVVKSGKISSSLVVCGTNARIILYPAAMVAGDGNAGVVAQGTGAQIVLADGKTLPAVYSATAGVTTCVTSPGAAKPGAPCTYYLPAPFSPSPAKKK